MRKKEKYNEQIITTIFIIICIIGYVYFPVKGSFQNKSSITVFLFLLPFIYNKIFFKKNILLDTIKLGRWRQGIKWSIISLSISFLLMFLIFKYTKIGVHYFLPINVKESFLSFLIYEFIGVGFTVFLYEFFFRGFVMFYFESFLKKWSILFQIIPFLLMVSLLNIPYWFYLLYLIFVPFAGIIAYKSRSILYSFLSQIIFISIIDAFYIAFIVK